MSEEELAGSGEQVHHHQAVLHDQYDTEAFEEARASYQKLSEAEISRKEGLATAPALLRDVFYAFHKPVVNLREADEMAASHLLNRQMVEGMLSTGEFKSLHHSTLGDEVASAIATVAASSRMLDTLDKATTRRVSELAALEEEVEQLMSQAQTLDALATKEAEAGPQTGRQSALAHKAEELQTQAKKAAARRDKLAHELTTPQALEPLENAARQAVRSALTGANQEIEELKGAIKAYTGGYDGDRGVGRRGDAGLTLADKVKLAQQVKNNPKLARIAEACGRFTSIALNIQKNKVDTSPPHQVVGLKTGDDLAHVLTSELATLSDPLLETVFEARFVDKKLLQYELEEREPQGRGPIIVALDSSGSMTSGAAGGISREVWSKGVALALVAIARLQKRDIALIHFSSPGQVRVDVFPKGQATPLHLMDTAQHFFGGGTEYAGWMEEALRLVDRAAFNRADVIIVSDGEVSIPPSSVVEWNRRRKEREMRSFAVLIGDTHSISELAEISESVTPLLDLTEDRVALNALFSI